MELTTVWFILIAVLWIGYLVLEGFDFGVGILLPVLGKDEKNRRVLLNTIGPIWDGNDVWVLVAGGATFAAFPEWYATLFSGFYIPLFIILIALIVRGVGFEYRSKRDSDKWRAGWDKAIFWGSLLPALLWGVALANIVRGVPIDENKEFVGNLFDLLNPYGLLGGLTTLFVFTTHGAIFVALKTVGDIRERARDIALKVGLVSVLIAGSFVLWTIISDPVLPVIIAGALAAVSLLAALFANFKGREGYAFLGTALTIAFAAVMLFSSLFPDVMPS